MSKIEDWKDTIKSDRRVGNTVVVVIMIVGIVVGPRDGGTNGAGIGSVDRKDGVAKEGSSVGLGPMAVAGVLVADDGTALGIEVAVVVPDGSMEGFDDTALTNGIAVGTTVGNWEGQPVG